MSARLSDGFTAVDAHPAEWSVLPDSWPEADIPLLAAHEVAWVTVAMVAATIAVLFGLV